MYDQSLYLRRNRNKVDKLWGNTSPDVLSVVLNAVCGAQEGSQHYEHIMKFTNTFLSDKFQMVVRSTHNRYTAQYLPNSMRKDP